MKKNDKEKRARLVVDKQTIRVLEDTKLRGVAGARPTGCGCVSGNEFCTIP